MADDMRPVGVTLTADTSQYDAAMAASAQQTQSLADSLDRVLKGIDRTTKGAGRKLMLIGAADIALMGAAGSAAASFENQMAGLDAQSQTLSSSLQQGRRTFEDYKGAVIDLRREFPVTTREATDLVRVISGFGGSSRQVKELASSFTMLAGATGESAPALAQGVLQLNRQMGNGTRDVRQYANEVLRLSANSNTSAQGLLQFSSALAPASRQLGIAQQDVLGISAAFSRAGADGGYAATTFNKVANDISLAIQTNSPQLKQYADLLGMSSDQLKGANKTDVMIEFFESLNRSGPSAIRTLQRLGFEGQRELRSIQAVAQQQGGIAGAIRDARVGFGERPGADTLERSSRAAFEDLESQSKKLGESLKRNAEIFGAPFATVLKELTKGMTGFSNVLGDALSGPMGGLLQWTARIVGPLALVSGFLVTMTGTMLKLAAIKGLFGAGTAGLLAGMGMGREGRGFIGGAQSKYDIAAARNAAGEPLRQGRGDFGRYRMGAFGAGSAIGSMFMAGADRWDAWRNPHESAEEREARRAARPSFLSRAVGVPVGLSTIGMNMTSSSMDSLIHTPFGRNPRDDVTQRYQQSMLRGTPWSGARLANMRDIAIASMAPTGSRWNPLTGAADRARERMFDRGTIPGVGAAQFDREAARAAKSAAAVDKSFGGVRGAAGALGRVLTSTAGAMLGTIGMMGRAGATGVGMAGRGVGGALMAGAAAHPIMTAALLVGGGAYAYDKWFSDRYDPASVPDYQPMLNSYTQRGRVFKPHMDIKNMEASANRARTTREALAFTPQARDAAARPGRKPLDPRMSQIGSKEAMLQSLAPSFAGMETIPPEDLAKLRTDLLQWSELKTGNTDAARWVLDRLQGPETKGVPFFGNRARQTEFDPGSFFWGQSKKATGQGYRQMFGAMAERRDLAYTSGGAGAAGTQARGDLRKSLDQAFAKGGAWRDGGGVLDRGLDELGGRREGFIKEFKKAYDIERMDIGGDLFSDDIKIGMGRAANKPEQFLEQFMRSVAGGDTDAGSFFADLGLTDVSGLEGGALNKAIRANLKKYKRDTKPVSWSDYTRSKEDQRKFDRLSEYVGRDTALDLYGDVPSGQQWSRGVGQVLGAPGDPVARLNATVSVFSEELGKANGNLQEVIERARKIAAIEGQTERGDLFRAVGAMATEQQNAWMAGQPLTVQSRTMRQNLTQLQQRPVALRDDQWATDMGAGFEQMNQMRVQLEEQLKSIAVQVREFAIQQAEQAYQFGLQQQRAYEDFHRMRQRAERDFNIQRNRAEHDFNLQQKYARADFNLSRRRQEEDFNHQVVLMAERSARQVYDIYERVNVQRTLSSANILMNGEDQLRRLQEQSANLDRLRKAGLSDDSIQQLGLTDAKNSQQAERLAQEVETNPEIVRQLNKQIRARIKAAKALVTDESSAEWEEMVRSYKLSRERAQEDFDKQMNRSRKAFQLALSRQRQDFRRSMNDQADDFHRSMRRMQQDQARSQEFARKAMERSIDDLNKNANQLIKEANKALDKAASQGLGKLKGSLRDAGKGIRDELGKVYKMMSTFFGNDIVSKVLKLIPFGGQGGPAGGQGGPIININGQGGQGGHVHGPGCGHTGAGGALGGLMSPSSGSGGPSEGGHGGISFRWPLRGRLTSGYGPRIHPITGRRSFHNGIDIAAPMGTPYYAPADGVVSSMPYQSWSGGRVPFISHGSGIQTFYGHSISTSVNRGQRVRKGQQIGRVGSRGFSTGPHLHFGASSGGRNIDPMHLLRGAPMAPSGSAGFVPTYILELKKRYPNIEIPLEEFASSSVGLDKNAMSGIFNDFVKKKGKKEFPELQYNIGGPDRWFQKGAIFTGPHIAGLGEGGPELALPLNHTGVEFIAELMRRVNVGPLNNARGQLVPSVQHITHNTSIDKSTTIQQVNVVAQDVNAFLRQLQAKQRQDALLNPTLAGSRQ